MSITRNYGRRANIDSGRESPSYGHTVLTSIEKPLTKRDVALFLVVAVAFIAIMVVGSAVVS